METVRNVRDNNAGSGDGPISSRHIWELEIVRDERSVSSKHEQKTEPGPSNGDVGSEVRNHLNFVKIQRASGLFSKRSMW